MISVRSLSLSTRRFINKTRLQTTRVMSEKVGTPYAEIETPSLLLMMDQFEANIQRMQSRADSMGVKLRPHAKSLKSSRLGKMQVDAGGVGLCAAKVTEVEKLMKGGINDVLLTNEIVARGKLERLADVVASTRGATLGICVDNASNVEEIQDVFAAKGVSVNIYIEIDVGQGRCGVEPGEACAVIAKKILSCDALTLKGIQAYSGWNQHIQTVPERATATEKGPVSGVKASLHAMRSQGIDTTGLVITGGGTGTYTLEGNSGGTYTEIQPGSYSVMDGEYGKTKPCDDTHYDNALFVLTTVMSDSSAHPDWLVVDAGDKAVHPGSAGITVLNAGYDPTTGRYDPSVHASGLTYRRGGDEHGIVEGPREKLHNLPIGTKLLLIPGHCDPTINFYDYLVACRATDDANKAVVEEVVSIEARGPGL